VSQSWLRWQAIRSLAGRVVVGFSDLDKSLEKRGVLSELTTDMTDRELQERGPEDHLTIEVAPPDVLLSCHTAHATRTTVLVVLGCDSDEKGVETDGVYATCRRECQHAEVIFIGCNDCRCGRSWRSCSCRCRV